MAGLKRNGLIDTWHDRRIIAGQQFADEIDQNFEDADIILLLISPDFINSDFCYNIEMRRAIQRHARGEAAVIPVILRPCDWNDLPFRKLLAATKDGKPIIKFQTIDDGFLEVVQAIKAAIKALPSASSSKTLEAVEMNVPLPQKSPPATATVRSSNLRVKRPFTDHDRDVARFEGFEYIARYFTNSLSELQIRNQGIKTNFRLIDANSFEAAIYLNGERQCYCGIWTNNGQWESGGIYFSQSGVTTNSYNDSMSIASDGYILGFKAMGIGFHGMHLQSQDAELLLSNEGAAEYYWNIFIQPLQS